MRCSCCGGRSRINDSRPRETIVNPLFPDNRASPIKVKAVYRRRVCRGCGHRWATYELRRSDMVHLSPDSREEIVSQLQDAAEYILASISALERDGE